MYDWPELRASTDALWSAWRDALSERRPALAVAAPTALDRLSPSMPLWSGPDLVASQCCGAQAGATLADAVTIIGAPSYAAEGCDVGVYSSVIVARRGAEPDALADAQTSAFAVNGFESHSGWWCLVDLGLAPTRTIVTGAHRASCDAVATGRAAAAAIDAVAWAHYRRFEPEKADKLSPIAWTRRYPAPPFVTRKGLAGERDALRAALRDAIARAPDAAAALLLLDVVPAEAARYVDFKRLSEAVAAGGASKRE